MESTRLDVKSWMDAVCHEMNESKMEFIYLGRKMQHQHSEHQWKTHSQTRKGQIPGRSSGQYTGLLPTCYNKMSSSKHQFTKKVYQKVPHLNHLSAINAITCHVAPQLCIYHVICNTKNSHKYNAKHKKLSN